MVMDPSTTLATMLKEYWDKLDRKEKSMIHLCVSDWVLLNMFTEDSAKKLWENLGSPY